MQQKKIAFILHGKISNRQQLMNEVYSVFNDDNEVSFFTTEHQGHSTELAAKAAGHGFRYIICVGGDGSLNEVANGIMQAKSAQPNLDIRLGIIPHGTGNDFVRTTHSPSDCLGLKKLIDVDSYKEIDLGFVQFKNPQGIDSSRYFINITDIGMGGVAAEKLNRFSKALGPAITYQAAILSTLISYRLQPIKAVADSFSFEGKVMNLIIANGKYFGSGMGVAPDAEVNDAKFSIVIVGEISLFDYFRHIGTIKQCKKIEHPQVSYKTASEITIDSLAAPQAIDMDGEFIGYSPMHLKVVPKAIRFICPYKNKNLPMQSEGICLTKTITEVNIKSV